MKLFQVSFSDSPIHPFLISDYAKFNISLALALELKPNDLRDFFSQEFGKALIPDRYIDIFQGRAPKGVLAKHYTPRGIRVLKETYDKAKLKVLE